MISFNSCLKTALNIQTRTRLKDLILFHFHFSLTLLSHSGNYLPAGAQVAQSVEQGTENPRVGSSILSLGTTSDFFPDIFSEYLF
jgi:hypothetical protein